jgi:hypothetical protein
MEWDGDESSLSSALELAIDQHCTIFLSSNEAQHGMSQAYYVLFTTWPGIDLLTYTFPSVIESLWIGT